MLAWPASIIHLDNEGTDHTPHGGKQAEHSRAAESGGIQMHVWGKTKENKAGRSEGHASLDGQHHTSGNKGTYNAPHGGRRANHSPPAVSGWIQTNMWGRATENKAG